MGNRGSREQVELGREEAATLARDTGFTEEGVRDWHRAFLKDHPTGHISRAKFVTMYRNFFTKGDTDQFSKNVFRVFDTDGSGTIEFGEFLTAIHATSSARPEEKLRWAFNMYDVNGDGRVQLEELKQVMSGLHTMMGWRGRGEEQAEELYAKMDQGEGGGVEVEAFIAACTSDPTLMAALGGEASPKKREGGN